MSKNKISNNIMATHHLIVFTFSVMFKTCLSFEIKFS